ncbi:MAG: hypothetical protein ACOCV2_07715, partial [Persicimonas sp.]
VEELDEEGRLAERRARESSGLVRPGEVIFEFEEDDEAAATEVTLEVEPDSASLAGREVAIDQLEERLAELDRELSRAHLTVRFAEKTDELRRQRVREAVADSAMSDADFETVEGPER